MVSYFMRRNGFTLIELLVVVAIIGILAAVGVVAYNGYTSAAKISAVKTIHAQTVKYIAAETKKCDLGETTVMNGQLTCDGMSKTTVVEAALTDGVFTDKNPYDGTTMHVRKENETTLKRGTIYLYAGRNAAENEVEIYSCPTKEVCGFFSKTTKKSIVTIK